MGTHAVGRGPCVLVLVWVLVLVLIWCLIRVLIWVLIWVLDGVLVWILLWVAVVMRLLSRFTVRIVFHVVRKDAAVTTSKTVRRELGRDNRNK